MLISFYFLEKVIGDLQYKIDQLLFITIPYDENSKELTYWNASENHKHFLNEEYDEEIDRDSLFFRERFVNIYKR